MKKIAIILMAAVLGFGLCLSATAQGTTKKVTITYGTFIGRDTDMVGATLDAYTKKYPNITFEYQIVDHAALQQKYDAMVQSNSLPDMFWWNGTHIVDAFNNSKSVLDLTPYFDAQFQGSFVKGSLKNLTTNDGKIVGFPAEMQVQGWVYNKALFDKYGLKIPTTYDELKKCVQTFKKNNVTTIAYGSKEGWAVWGFQAWLLQWGIWQQADAVFKTHTLKAADADFKQAYYALAELRDLGAFPEDNSTMSFDQMVSMFNAGNAAMITLPSDQLAKIIGQPLEKNYVYNFGVTFPNSKYPQNVVVRSVGNGFGISSNVAKDKDKLAAIIAFNKWRYGPEGFALALKTGAILPVNVKYDSSTLGPIMRQQVAMIQDSKYDTTVNSGMNSDYAPYWRWNSNADLWTQGWGTVRGNLENSLMNGSMTAKDIPGELAKIDEGIAGVLAQLKK